MGRKEKVCIKHSIVYSITFPEIIRDIEAKISLSVYRAEPQSLFDKIQSRLNGQMYYVHASVDYQTHQLLDISSFGFKVFTDKRDSLSRKVNTKFNKEFAKGIERWE